MADEKNNPSATGAKKKPKKKTADTISTIIFVVLIIAMVVITIMLLRLPKSKIYSKVYNNQIETLVEVYTNGEVDLAVSIDGERTIQQGTYTVVGEKEENSYNGEYEAIFKGETEVKVNMVIKDDKLTLTYDDGTVIEFKEREES